MSDSEEQSYILWMFRNMGRWVVLRCGLGVSAVSECSYMVFGVEESQVVERSRALQGEKNAEEQSASPYASVSDRWPLQRSLTPLTVH